MSTELEEKVKSKGGRPRNAAPPTTSAEVKALMAQELVKSTPDRFKVQGLTRLLDAFETEEAKAAATIATENAALEAANTELAMLREQVAKVAPLEEQLTALRAGQDEWKAEQLNLLTAQSQHQLALAEKAEREASHKLALIESNYSQPAMMATFDLIRGLIEQANIPQPDFWSAPPTLAPVFWTLWGWSPAKAKIFTAYRVGYPSCTDGFRAHAFQMLSLTVPTYGVETHREPVDNFAERLEVIREMCQRWRILDSLTLEIEQIHASRYGAYRQSQLANLASQEIENARHGAGRVSIQAEQPASSVPLSEHVLGCPCNLCGGSGLDERLREDLTLGTSTPRIEQDLNTPRPLTYGENE